jgi:hypothetical protein
VALFLEALELLLVVKVVIDVEAHEADEGLENDLAVMVTSGFETLNSFWLPEPPVSLDLDFAAAAKTSAILLLKVSGIAEEPELSEFLNS